MSNFNYKFTCPDIDSSISCVIDDVKDTLLDMLSRITDYDSIDALVTDYAESIYNIISDNFEAVRQTNEDIRNAAESQITEARDELADLQVEYENEVRDLEQQIDELQEELYRLQEE